MPPALPRTACTLPVCLCVSVGMCTYWMSRNVHTKGWALCFTWETYMMFLYTWFLQPAGNLIISAQPSAVNRDTHRRLHTHMGLYTHRRLWECPSPPSVCHGSYYCAAHCCQCRAWEERLQHALASLRLFSFICCMSFELCGSLCFMSFIQHVQVSFESHTNGCFLFHMVPVSVSMCLNV